MNSTSSDIDPSDFREVCGCYATGVTVVTVLDGQRRPFGVTANSFTSVSLDPPLVQFSLDRGASVFPVFEATDAVVINVLARDQQSLSSWFSKNSDGFDAVTHATWASGCPVLDGCLANIECTKYAVYDGGDHVIILGRVRRLACAAGEPLLFYRGAYGDFS